MEIVAEIARHHKCREHDVLLLEKYGIVKLGKLITSNCRVCDYDRVNNRTCGWCGLHPRNREAGDGKRSTGRVANSGQPA